MDFSIIEKLNNDDVYSIFENEVLEGPTELIAQYYCACFVGGWCWVGGCQSTGSFRFAFQVDYYTCSRYCRTFKGSSTSGIWPYCDTWGGC